MKLSFPKRDSTLATRFVASASILLVLTLGAMTAFIVKRERELLNRDLRERARSTASLVGKLCFDPLLYKDTLKIDAIASEVLKEPEVEYAMVQAADGTWATTVHAGVAAGARKRLAIADDASPDRAMGALRKEEGIERAEVAIAEGDWTVGKMEVGLSRASADAAVRRLVWQMLAGFASVIALLAGTLWALSHVLITKPLAEAVALAGRLAEGDLTEAQLAPARGEAATMASLVAQLRETIRRIRAASRDVAGASSQIAASAGQTVASAESQATTAKQTAVAVQELETGVDRLAATASEIAQTMRWMGTTGEALRGKLAETAKEISAMQGEMGNIASAIVTQAEKAQDVQQILESVADLADRTKVVSLNASIEATRSGVEGRGFAVVANEMRVLSDESRMLAGSTARIVGEVAQGAAGAARSTTEGQGRFQEGLRRIDEVLSQVEQFAKSVESSQREAAAVLAGITDQSVQVRQIAEAVQDTHKNVQQMLAQTQQLDSAAKALAEVSRQLEGSVEMYRLE